MIQASFPGCPCVRSPLLVRHAPRNGAVRHGDSSPILSENVVEVVRESARAAVWLSAAVIAKQLMQFAMLAVLSRILSPAELGLAALVITVNVFASLYTDLGIAQAVVHRESLDITYLSSAFWLNAITGTVVAAIVLMASDLVSSLVAQPALAGLLAVTALNFVFSLGVVNLGLLERRIAFKSIAIIELSAALLGQATTLALVLRGHGVLSIVLGQIATTVAISLLGWACAPFRLKPCLSPVALLEIWRYTRGLIGFSSVNYWARNSDIWLVGSFLGAASLGYYSRAYQLMMLPVVQVGAVLSRLLFPILAARRIKGEALGATWINSMRLALMMGVPVSAILITCAADVVRVILGPGWAQAAELLPILAISIVPQALGKTFGAVLQAVGRTGLQFWLGLGSTLVSLGLIWMGVQKGVTAVAVAVVVALTFGSGTTGWFVLRTLGLRVRDLGTLLPALLAGSAQLPVQTLVADSLPADMNALFRLAVVAGVGVGAYAAGLVLMDHQVRAWLIDRLRRVV